MNEVTSIMIQRIEEIEQRDEQQILAELAGEAIEDFIYEITDKKGKRTVKLSWAGTREMARYRGNIHLDDPIITEADGYVRIVVRATDLKRNFSIFGGCHQPKVQKVKTFDENGKDVGHIDQEDPHYFPKALSKAQRNVLQAIIPADFVAKMIDRFLVASGKPPLKQLSQGKRPVPKPRLNAEVAEPAELKTLFDLEKYAYNRWHIQPAEMYKELGFSNKTEVNEPPWDCYLRLRQRFEAHND